MACSLHQNPTIELGVEYLFRVMTVSKLRGESNEQISKVVPNDMVLSISYRVGTKIKIQGVARRGGKRSREPHSSIFTSTHM